jgi:hypothetical protein
MLRACSPAANGDPVMQKNVVIAGYARSPFHFAHKGALTKVRLLRVNKSLKRSTGISASTCGTPCGSNQKNHK